MHPSDRASVVRKAVGRAITSRLRRLGMDYDYDVSGSGPRMLIPKIPAYSRVPSQRATGNRP